jgi:hypothetical protein
MSKKKLSQFWEISIHFFSTVSITSTFGLINHQISATYNHLFLKINL